MRLAVCFDNLGPYHAARLKHLADRCNLFVLQYRWTSTDYQWSTIQDNSFATATIMEEGDLLCKQSIYSRLDLELSKFNPDVVAIPGWATRFAHMLMKWCSLNRVPMILMSDSQLIDFPRNWVKEWLKSKLIRLFSAALVAGTKHRDYLHSLDFDVSRIRIGYDVVDNCYFSDSAEKIRAQSVDYRKRFKLPDSFFLCCARLIEKKNISYLIDSYSTYVRRDSFINGKFPVHHLVIVGDGPLKNELIRKIAMLGLSDKIDLRGFISYEEIPVFYALADWFVLPSISDQWGLVVNEAMACGLPVIVSERCGCSHDLVFNGVNGFVFDPLSKSSLAAIFHQVQDNRESSQMMGDSSRAIISKWDLSRFSDAILEAGNVACSSPISSDKFLSRFILNILFVLSR